mmetsp:Transcript_13839/g.32858  ORF Transcript_13839/g.32858 Transcript_13839/m.32858 type:complete len:84 (-) Transcript_13839:15-266(-)
MDAESKPPPRSLSIGIPICCNSPAFEAPHPFVLSSIRATSGCVTQKGLLGDDAVNAKVESRERSTRHAAQCPGALPVLLTAII